MKTLNLLLLLSLFLLTNCQKSEQLLETAPVTLFVDGTAFAMKEAILSGNENCGTLYLYSKHKLNNDKGVNTLRFELQTNGQLVRVTYVEDYDLGSKGMNTYKTSYLESAKSFDIKNFTYDKDSGKLTLEFEGTVFLETDAAVNKKLAGKIETENLKTITCTAAIPSIRSITDDEPFNSIHTASHKFENNKKETHYFFSNNGYAMTLLLDESATRLTNSSIHFDENSDYNKIVFREFIGPLVFDIQAIATPEYWKTYQTRGVFHFQNDVQMGGWSMKTGKITLEVVENNNVVKVFDSLLFNITQYK